MKLSLLSKQKREEDQAAHITCALKKLKACCTVVLRTKQSSNKEVYLIVKEQLTLEDVFPAPVRKLGFVQHVSFIQQSPSAWQY